MYYKFFGLKQPPFKITPDTDFFFEGGNRGAVLEALIYAITQGEGIVKVTGEVGSGKTMLCRVLQARLPANVETVYLANPSVSPDEILHAIAFELQLPLARDAGRLEVMHALTEYLLRRHEQGRQVVVFVEESQSMPLATLEEIRLLSNLETRQHKLLQIVLFGQPELDVNLKKPQIRQLRERITHSFALPPLTAAEIKDYLGFRLRAAGYHGPDLFGPHVMRYLARATEGLTRRINIVADKAMLAAFAENTHNIALKHVRAAVADSEFTHALPAPGLRPWAKWLAGAGLAAAAVALASAGYDYWQHRRPPVTTAASTSLAQKPASTPVEASAPEPSASMPPATEGEHVLPTSAPAAPAPAPAMATPATLSSPPLATPDAGVQGGNPEKAWPAAEAGTQATDLLERRLLATQRWLAEERAGIFSIQLLGSNDPALLKSYLESLSNYIDIDKIFVYRTVANQEPTMTVLYGAFAARAEAMRSLEALPIELKANRPYIRTVQGIRSEIGLNKTS
jgi:type II secretory pathway predicted ATPase ExeA/septal ring-binding cell division protein DamX